MGKHGLQRFLAFVSLALLFFVVVIHLRFVILPVFFLALGLLSYLWSGRKALLLFLFLLPLINSTPDIFFNGYPFNYMGVALFYLSGMLIASRVKKEKPEFAFPGYRLYLLLLILIGISTFFVFLRWSNLTLSPLAFLRDTPVSPDGERLSFACIFPAITLALFSLSPFLASLIRHWRLKENEIFIPLKAGFCLSFLLALVQKWLDPDFLAQSWWGLKMHQVNGGFSDFNAFGFFAGAMFFYQALRLIDALPRHKQIAFQDKSLSLDDRPRSLGFKVLLPEILFLATTLAAIFVSGCRTAFLFVLLAVSHFLFTRKASLRIKVPVILLLAGFLLVAGGPLKKRLQQSTMQATHLTKSANPFDVADQISSGRLIMLGNATSMIVRFPLSGIGSGNFLFYLKYLNFGKTFYEDLPLNQYLLVTSEAGLAAGLLFVLFLLLQIKRQKTGVLRFLIAAMAFAILFNNFFWFPECFLLFWIFMAGGERLAGPGRDRWPAWMWGVVLVFVAANAMDFRALHPETLTWQKGSAYDYGFWPAEKNERGTFSWTRGAAGKYFNAAAGRDFALFCAVPQSSLEKENMTVELFWRGELFQRVVFIENKMKKFRLPRGQKGFLEIRVSSTFNMKAMGLGMDARELGVQFMELPEALP